MTRQKVYEMLKMMEPDTYITVETIADRLSISEKNVRLELNDLKKTLLKHGAAITSKPRFGYLLNISEPPLFEEYMDSLSGAGCMPDSLDECVDYLLAYLIFRQDYVKTEELCDFIYVSKKKLSKCLKRIEEIIDKYHLTVERRPGCGIRITGDEFDKRRLIVNSFVKIGSLGGINISRQLDEISVMAKKIYVLMSNGGIFLSELSLDNFVSYVYVACKRMKAGNSLEDIDPPAYCVDETEKLVVREIVKYLSERFGVQPDENEEKAMLVYLMAGRRTSGDTPWDETNFVVHEKINELGVRILKLVSDEYHINIAEDFGLMMALNLHLVSFDIRMRYEISIRNPLLEEIKRNYAFAYQASEIVANMLSEVYKKPVSEDERGYFALLLQLALETQRSRKRYNILIVCRSGNVSSQLLKHKYQQEFAEYLDHIWVCDISAMERFDFSEIDYVFTTVPIVSKVPVPVIEIGHFLDEKDKRKMVDAMAMNDTERMMGSYYSQERFLTTVEGATREEVIKAICEVISRQEEVDSDFFELVMERESLIQMNYGTRVAIPHPARIASEYSFAYVAVLPEPVDWHGSPVQVVLLISIGRKEDSEESRRMFYEMTARFTMNKCAVEELIEQPSYSRFLQLYKK